MKPIFNFNPIVDTVKILHAEDAIQACVFISQPNTKDPTTTILPYPEFKNQIFVLKQISYYQTILLTLKEKEELQKKITPNLKKQQKIEHMLLKLIPHLNAGTTPISLSLKKITLKIKNRYLQS